MVPFGTATSGPVSLIRQGLVLSADIRVAARFSSRLRGLLFSVALPAGSGLLLMRCNCVHMFFMAYAIDVVFLDGDWTIVSLHRNVRPWRVVYFSRSRHVLELGSGSIDAWNLCVGEGVQLI